MDIQQFISSGIIEAYVLGMASDEEVLELESLSARYPEIASSIKDYQQSMEDYSMIYAIQPPAGLKDHIWSVLEQESKANSGAENPDSPTVQQFIHQELKSANHRPLYGSIAAAVVLLIGSLIFNFIFWNKSASSEKELASLKTQQQEANIANQNIQQQLSQSNKNIQLLLDPAMKSILLAGVGTHTANNARVVWDTRSKEVYLSLKDLPPPPSGKQYQLWAIVDGKPVDAGMYVLNQQEAMQKMKIIPNAEMFAITLEKEGGSEAPTMEEMYVAGKV